jgi:hypothetical protein
MLAAIQRCLLSVFTTGNCLRAVLAARSPSFYLSGVLVIRDCSLESLGHRNINSLKLGTLHHSASISAVPSDLKEESFPVRPSAV